MYHHGSFNLLTFNAPKRILRENMGKNDISDLVMQLTSLKRQIFSAESEEQGLGIGTQADT